MIFQIIGLIALSIISFVVFSLLVGICTPKKRLDSVLFIVSILLMFIFVNSLFFAGWIVVFNIFDLQNSHTFQSSFQTIHFVVYFVVILLLLKPLSILMEKSAN